MVEIPIWLLIILIITNVVSVCVFILICEIVCYIHDMIKVDMWYKKYKGERKE